MLERLAGNAALKADWQAALAADRLPHALLLLGEPGFGAGFAARCLAADWQYPAGGPHAEALVAGRDSECIVLRGEGASHTITVDAVRAAREAIGHSALLDDARGRVLLLYGAQDLNASSANALLKILEEPPADVLFLLTAPSAAAVLPTIRSRCAAYTLAPVPQAEALAWLRRLDPALAPERAQELTLLYDGALGAMQRALQDPFTAEVLADARTMCRYITHRDRYLLQAALSAYEGERKANKKSGKKKAKPGAEEAPPEKGGRAGTLRLIKQLRCAAAAALRRPGFWGLEASRAAAVLQAVENARTAAEGSGNLRIVLTVLGIELLSNA